MADTPIDRAENLTSIRLKVPTGTVPVPPPGHLQLHAPDYDTLAVRRGDGSVVEIGGSSGPTDTLVGSGGIITASAGQGWEGAGLSLLVGAGESIYVSGPFVGPGGEPLASDAVMLVARSVAPDLPAAGRVVLFVGDDGTVRQLDEDGGTHVRLKSGDNALLVLGTAQVLLSNGAGAGVSLDGTGVQLSGGAGTVFVDAAGVALDLGGGRCSIAGLPTADPHVADALWIAPLTRQLMVSAG